MLHFVCVQITSYFKPFHMNNSEILEMCVPGIYSVLVLLWICSHLKIYVVEIILLFFFLFFFL